MHRSSLAALLFLAALGVHCSSPTTISPTPAGSGGSKPSSGAPSAVPSAAASAAATSPQFRLSGARAFDCVRSGRDPIQWALDISDAGPRGVHFVAHTHHDASPGCGATVKNPRKWVSLDGPQTYDAHASGRTTFTFDPRYYTCGRVQVDVSLIDGDGHETLLVAFVVDYGSTCEPQLTCGPATQSLALNASTTLTAVGGTGTYTWSVPDGTATSGSGPTFTTSFAAPGTKTATVTSGSQTASCQIEVQTSAPLACSPSTQTVAVNAPATLTASGGSGTYNWIAFVASVTSGTGTSFTTSYALAGTKAIVLGDGLTTTSCQVIVN